MIKELESKTDLAEEEVSNLKSHVDSTKINVKKTKKLSEENKQLIKDLQEQID